MDDDDDELDPGNGPLYDTDQRHDISNGITDLTDVSPLLLTRDYYPQGDIVEGVMRRETPMTIGGDVPFFQEKVRTLNVPLLRRHYEQQNAEAAIQHLNTRSRITLTKEEVFDPLDPSLVWVKNTHYLDFLMVVPKDYGFDAIIPNEASNHNYTFEMTMTQQQKPWIAKYGELGFDPTRRMLYIGKAQGQQVWLGMVPTTFWDDEIVLPNRYTEDVNAKSLTIVPRGRYRRLVYLMASMCARADINGINVVDDYPEDIIDSTIPHAWSARTNIA